MQNRISRPSLWPSLAFVALGVLLFAVFQEVHGLGNLSTHVPEFAGLMLAAGGVYLIAAYLAERTALGWLSLTIILIAAAVFRVQLLRVSPSLSDDVYRYQWEGRVLRAGINPYRVAPSEPGMQAFQNPAHPIRTGRNLPTLYPPVGEILFAAVHSVRGYKRLYTGFDFACIGMILLLLGALRLPLHRVVIYAWNPAVLVSFALSAHNDAPAVFALMAATYFIIRKPGVVSNALLGVAALVKLFPAALLPLYLRRTKLAYAGIFATVIALGYLPFFGAGADLFKGLHAFARGWEANDSLFRLIRAAGNTKPQADLIAGLLFLALIAYVLKAKLDPLRASLWVVAGLLLLSSSAFPWYFTWFTPFLCFELNPALLLVTVTCVLGYAPVITYVAGVSFRNPPLMLWLEYAPVYALLAWQIAVSHRRARKA